ncbi:Schizosaccharomyces pombe specific protein [Schizosaccharomyces pombe]|uniref:Uncharacterized protein C683.03 n=1 Tax=Schizosaccharomyces pombe (strain 972 / ATCC 24843) TaxID=284812 RepID=YL93_SCHPO|nr:uncharacterized protein SPAC683.03 [Schizosaccharomyces pombe]Q96VG3.1 RecName: Full=Uncharacterized protein C683.03 [Schizosaccharomyces pombe 972h-]CAC41386.1 sequence orphan [Schizosaccharomyces pombe]|eukprot:NP_594480.1 uncharacterized protein SPAC683.03 [Schizosaccharomyces pombe]
MEKCINRYKDILPLNRYSDGSGKCWGLLGCEISSVVGQTGVKRLLLGSITKFVYCSMRLFSLYTIVQYFKSLRCLRNGRTEVRLYTHYKRHLPRSVNSIYLQTNC